MSHAALSTGHIRLALAGVPGLLASMVYGSVRGQADIAVVGEVTDADDITELAGSQPIDVLLTSRTAEGVPVPCQRLLFGTTSIPVIVIGDEGKLEVYDRRDLREAAIDDLLAEIRRVALRGTTWTPR